MFSPIEQEPSQAELLNKHQELTPDAMGVPPPAPVATPPEDFNPQNPKKFKTNLVLTVEQEAKLTDRILKRIEEIKSENGLEANGVCRDKSWMHRRELYKKQYDNDWEWREALGGIFSYSNFSLNICKRYARLMAAKTADDLLGTEPFFATMPTAHGDPELAKQIEWFLQEKIGQSNLKESVAEGEKVALIINEAVMKQSYVINATHYRGPATVAVGPFQYETPNGVINTPPGDPVMTPKGNYIYPKDEFVPDPLVEGLMRLRKEPTVATKFAPEYAPFPDLDQTIIHSEGLDCRDMFFKDFLCPLNVEDIHEADINVHLFDEPFERLKFIYGNFEVADSYFTNYESAARQAMIEKGEQETTSEVLHFVNCADAYIRFDADDDGNEEEIWAVIDTRNRKPIWYDYLGNHMRRRPFEVIPGIEKVPNRWYGVGVFEHLEHKQRYIDTQFNRVNFKSTKTSSIRFRNINAVREWRAGEQLVIGDDKFWSIDNPAFNAQNPPIFQVSLSEVDEYAMRLMELAIQASQTEIGISGPDDGAMSGLDTTKLATGIKALERTGNVLMKFTESVHAKAIERILEQAIEIVLEHMDESEVIYHPDSQKILELNKEEIRRMRKDIRLLLTRSRSTETIETGRQVTALAREYYEALTPFEQYKLRPEYIKQLRALEVQDPDNLLEEVTKDQAMAWMANQGKPPPTPPKESIAFKPDDLGPGERAQAVAKMGIQPDAPEVVAADQAQKAEAEAKVKESSNGKTNGQRAGENRQPSPN